MNPGTGPAPGAPIVALLLGAAWHGDDPGGMHRYLADLLGALHDRGTATRATLLGPGRGAPVGVFTAGSAGLALPLRLWRYRRAAQRAGADATLVDAHFALYALGPVVFGRLRGLPLVVHFQGPWAAESESDESRRSWRTAAQHLVEETVYRRAREVIVLSGPFKRALVEGYGIAPWRISVVPPGVDLDRFRPGSRDAARARLGLPADARVAVAVRRLVPRMGIDVLIKAWQEVAASDPDAILVVAGDGPERAGLEQLARSRDLTGSVRFLGRVSEPDLVACYQAADVSVVPSLELEGFGLVVLEALACGTVVVASDAGGLPAVLGPLDRDLIVPARDSTALAGRLQAVLDGAGPDAPHCRSYAETFSWDRAAARHQAIYQRAVRPVRDRLRVVYLVHSAQLSGGELALLRLLPALVGVDPHVVLAEDGPLVAKLIEAGISAEVLPMGEPARNLSRHRVRPGRLPVGAAYQATAYTLRLARRLRRLHPDLVHTNSLKADLYGGVAGRLARLPVVWHLRDRLAVDYLPGAAIRLVRAMARLVPAAVVANSRATLDTLGPVAVPTAVVPSPVGIDSSRGRPARREAGDALRVGMVGRLAPWKGQHVFLDAFAKAFPVGPETAVVVGSALFGEDDYAAQLVQRAEELGIGARVEWRGFRDDVAQELARLDILVHASTIPEPFGQVVVEGMAMGLAVAAADAGGPSEVLTSHADGILYPPGDSAALAGVLTQLADDAGVRRRLGAAAKIRAADFSKELVAQQIMVVYRQAQAGWPRGGGD